ncbi:uncharacterized protein LOC127703729 isoform X2 [Mytilus californianus]|uniref:uncharacterized protein LOC127703729 isoform X2 n=1 Tax=Mytilus californianus TaxID=6549 RepID=UPI0022462E32|nr:uncharacterized protein LOC127703729 isoform X2 [Mytilus californianus]
MALPLITKRQTQMTYNAAEDKGSMNNGSTPRNKERPNLEEKYWSTDIVKQVETWMKNQRFSEQYAPSSQRSQYTPPIQSERSRKRRRKRPSQKDGESGGEYTESINYTDSEIVSTVESKAIQRKLFEKEDKKLMKNNGVKVYPSKVDNGYVNRDNMYNKSFERPNKNSRFGSIHDEIEFQKRYKRISDLQNHLQFVNGSYLSGKNILVEQKKLAPVTDFSRRFKQLNPSEMFAISPLEHLNIKTKSKPKHYLQATQVTHNSRYKSKKKTFPWQKFQKLPDISPDHKPPKKALSESDVKLGDEIDRDTARSGYISSLLSQDDTRDERVKSVVTDSSYGPYQEMKVTIHIRYKNQKSSPEVKSEDEYVSETSSVQSSEDNTSRAYDGRLNSNNQEKTTSRENKITSLLSQNDQNLVHSTNFRGLSRTSNMSKSSKENYKNYEGGTLSSLVISDPVSKMPRHNAGKIRE